MLDAPAGNLNYIVLPENRGAGLRPFLNSLVIRLEGFGDRPEELAEIPETRSFFGALHRRWPRGLCFCSLEAPNLLAMTLSCLDTVRVVSDYDTEAHHA